MPFGFSALGEWWKRGAKLGGWRGPAREDQVTRKTFALVCDEVEELLPTCEFIAMDLEMTALDAPRNQLSWADSPEERYRKMRKVVMSNNIIQVGFCLFNQKGSKLQARPYTVFVFPAGEGRGFSPRVSLDARTTRQFHCAECNLDFNKWIYDGVPFTDAFGEERCREDAGHEGGGDNVYRARGAEGIVVDKESDRLYVNTAMNRLQDWLNGAGDQAGRPEFVLERTNSYLRLATMQTIARHFPWLVVSTRTDASGGRDVVCMRPEVYTDSGRRQRVRDDASRTLRERVGFRHMFKMLAASGKPLVLHNGLYDLMFLLSHFGERLAEELHEFKAQVKACFPELYDTKFVSELPELRPYFASSALKDVYQTVRREVKGASIVFPSGFQKYALDNLHNAGWDAYASGFIYARLRGLIHSEKHEGKACNRLWLMKSLFTVCLEPGVEDALQREDDAVLYVEGDGVGDMQEKILDVFKPSAAYLKPVDDNSMFVIIPDTSQAKALKLVNQPGKGDTLLEKGVAIMTLEEFQTIQASKQQEENPFSSPNYRSPRSQGGGGRNAPYQKFNDRKRKFSATGNGSGLGGGGSIVKPAKGHRGN